MKGINLVSLLCTISLFSCLVQGSIQGLEGCKLYVGGDFKYSSASDQLSGLMALDAPSGSVISDFDNGSVYKDAPMNNVIQLENYIFFAGDIVRAGESTTMTIGSYNLDDDDFEGVDGGIWTLGNILPTEDSAISPTALFAERDKKLLIAGYFEHQPQAPLESMKNIAEYDLETKKLTPLSGTFPCSDCSVISLTSSTSTNDTSIFVVTMDTKTFETSAYRYQLGRWSPFSDPVVHSDPVTLLFDNLVVIDQSLFALGYPSSASLHQSQIPFYLLRWNISEPTLEPEYVSVWNKSCSEKSGILSYPLMRRIQENLLVTTPASQCATGDVSKDITSFQRYQSTDLEILAPGVPLIALRGFVSQMQVSSKGDVFISNGTSLYRYLSGGKSWTRMINNQTISSFCYSDSKSKLYVSSIVPITGGVVLYESYGWDNDKLRPVFEGGVYSQGDVLTITPLTGDDSNSDQVLIGGDFKWVGSQPVPAKFAALWSSGKWKSTLERNTDDFLPGWKLLSSVAIGPLVFGIADAGNSPGKLPVVLWSEELGNWQYLTHRPVLITGAKYNPALGVAYADHKRGKVYFGGEFTVRIYDGRVTQGVAVYTLENKSWDLLPVNLSRVSAIGGIDGNELVQIGGQFQAGKQQNYLIWDADARSIVSDVPSLEWSEIYAMGMFPGQPMASFIGGNFEDHGVEQLRVVNGKWTFSGTGSSSAPPVVYSLSARNQGTDLFAGGSFLNGLARFDIVHQQWSPVFRDSVLFEGTVYSVMLSCNSDVPYYSYGSELDYWENFGGHCHIEGGENVCSAAPLNGWQIFGLCFTVLVTLVIISVIGILVLKTLKKQNDTASQNFEVEYI